MTDSPARQLNPAIPGPLLAMPGLLLALLLSGCPPADPPDWCSSPTVHLYQPFAAPELHMWPDDLITRPDPDSPTGLRLDVTAETAPWTVNLSSLVQPAVADLEALSGFAANGGILFRFNDAVGPGPLTAEESLESADILLVELREDAAIRVPFTTVHSDLDRTLILEPLRPLTLGARHAAVITTDFQDASGRCVQPGRTMKQLLAGDGDDERITTLSPRYAQALSALDVAADEVSAATVFTVHRDLDPVIDAAAAVRNTDVDWSTEPTCRDEAEWRVCEGAFTGRDFRDGDYIATADSTGSWELTVTAWLPLTEPGPYHGIIWGHGLNSGRRTGDLLAEFFVPEGAAVIALDSVEHGDHPTAADNDGEDALSFLGMTLEPPSIEGLVMRGNFNQTALDRLHLVELLIRHGDLDGDGIRDVFAETLSYFGASLGAMEGVSLMALSDDLGTGILTVGGGNLMQFVTDSRTMAEFLPLLETAIGSPEQLERLLPVAQALVDPADPATWGAHLLRDRLVGDVPNLLVPVSIFDEVVPPSSGRSLARALRIPHAPPVLDRVNTLAVTGPLPVSGNIDDGRATAAFFQFDRMTDGSGAVVTAGHSSTPGSPEGIHQATEFLRPLTKGSLPVVVDPYEALGTGPLE